MCVAAVVAGCGGGSADHSARIASAAGASSCQPSGYGLKNRFDGTKTDIYNCWIRGVEKCVTEEGGLTHDMTVTARLVFANDLSGKKPDCVKT
jgi:hypothetical protein